MGLLHSRRHTAAMVICLCGSGIQLGTANARLNAAVANELISDGPKGLDNTDDLANATDAADRQDAWLIGVIQKTDDAEIAAKAYRRLFAGANEARLTRLQTHEDDSVALKAAWRLAGLGFPRDKTWSRPQAEPDKVHRFFGVVEARLGVELPDWWRYHFTPKLAPMPVKSPIAKAGDDADDPILRSNPFFPMEQSESKSVSLLMPTTQRLLDPIVSGGPLRLKTAEVEFPVPSAFLMENIRKGETCLSGLINGNRIYLAMGHGYGRTFPLQCLNRRGEVVWQRRGWATGFNGGSSGWDYSAFEMRLVRDRLVILGFGFVEAYDLETGAARLRFAYEYSWEMEPSQ